MEQREKRIGDNMYRVTPFMAVEALKLKTKLFKLFGPAIGKVISGVSGIKNGVLDSEVNGEALAGVLGSLFEELDESMMLELVNRLLRQTIVELSHPVYEGTKPIRLIVLADGDAAFNQVFQGKLVDMYKVIFFVLEVNYPDFFELIGKRIGSQLPITSSNGQKEEVQTA